MKLTEMSGQHAEVPVYIIQVNSTALQSSKNAQQVFCRGMQDNPRTIKLYSVRQMLNVITCLLLFLSCQKERLLKNAEAKKTKGYVPDKLIKKQTTTTSTRINWSFSIKFCVAEARVDVAHCADVTVSLLRLGARESIGVKSHELALVKPNRNSPKSSNICYNDVGPKGK